MGNTVDEEAVTACADTHSGDSESAITITNADGIATGVIEITVAAHRTFTATDACPAHCCARADGGAPYSRIR